MKKKVKVKYLFTGPLYDWYSNFFTPILNRYYNVEISETPEYVFFAAHEEKHLAYDCIRISFAAENVRADFNLCDYAVGFDHLQFEDRYLRYPLYLLYSGSLEKASIKHLDVDESTLRAKLKFCNFLVSNGNSNELRVQFFELLSRYKSVVSGGAYKNNLGYRVEDKLKFQSDFKFSICFENSSTSGYLTEKLFQAKAAATIPIYWGDCKASLPLKAGGSGLNSRAFINVHDYHSMIDVIDYIKEVDIDDRLFLTILKEPVFLDENHREIFDEQLTSFLRNIFDQPYEMAFRRGFGQVRVGVEKRRIAYIKSKSTFGMIKEFSRRIIRKFQLIKQE